MIDNNILNDVFTLHSKESSPGVNESGQGMFDGMSGGEVIENIDPYEDQNQSVNIENPVPEVQPNDEIFDDDTQAVESVGVAMIGFAVIIYTLLIIWGIKLSDSSNIVDKVKKSPKMMNGFKMFIDELKNIYKDAGKIIDGLDNNIFLDNIEKTLKIPEYMELKCDNDMFDGNTLSFKKIIEDKKMMEMILRNVLKNDCKYVDIMDYTNKDFGVLILIFGITNKYNDPDISDDYRTKIEDYFNKNIITKTSDITKLLNDASSKITKRKKQIYLVDKKFSNNSAEYLYFGIKLGFKNDYSELFKELKKLA